MGNWANTVSRWSRNIHRDISFLCSGVLVVYVSSGIALNHKDSFNSNFDIKKSVYIVGQALPEQQDIKKKDVLLLLEEIGEENQYTKHYFPEKGSLKVFLKGGSNLVVDIASGHAVYEKVTRRPFFSAISRLHYNPGKWWTTFSDIFAISLLVIVLTGFLMIKGRRGLWGIGGIELLIGIAIPLFFLFFW